MLTVFFVDEGQDFLEWDINKEGEVIACRPFQSWLWVGVKVQNKDIKRGDLITYTKDGARHQLIHPVEKVKQLEGANVRRGRL